MARQDNSFINCYIRANAGRGRDLIMELEKRGGRNAYAYKGEGDLSMIYYIGKDGIIQWTEENSEIGYVILHSGWEEVKLKQHKRERMYLISVREGNDHCKKCNLYKKCDDMQEKKCEIASLLKTDKSLDGKTMAIMEVEPDEIPFHVFEKIKELKPAR